MRLGFTARVVRRPAELARLPAPEEPRRENTRRYLKEGRDAPQPASAAAASCAQDSFPERRARKPRGGGRAGVWEGGRRVPRTAAIGAGARCFVQREREALAKLCWKEIRIPREGGRPAGAPRRSPFSLSAPGEEGARR